MAMSIVGLRARALPWPIWIRTATIHDVDGLSDHFGTLSQSSRHNRFMGAVGNFARIAHDCLAPSRSGDRFTLVAETPAHAGHRIVGEASYAFDRDARWGEFAISVADRWQRRGLGAALLAAVQARAVSLGYFDLFGETLKTNEAMRRLACRAGFATTRASDWRAVRFDMRLGA
ncbi:GNAT family N-acetyltransferase [Bradyrhizobium sp. STM 3557]|uniref:GNAT family N-acetyltransferase n=1 Tax=Bradyrhizobium sp. STM 3557 TaxID=578920 RepID=UPI00388E975D